MIQHRWLVLGLLGTGQLMLILDVTVVAIALPHTGTSLGISREVLTWVVSGYSLTFGGLLLLGGTAADRFGPKPVVLVGLGVVTVASLVAGLAETGPITDLVGHVGQTRHWVAEIIERRITGPAARRAGRPASRPR